MPMPPYPIFCYSPECKNLAVYKIAGRWSNGVLGELKTYALCCQGCVKHWFEQSRRKQASCRPASGETLEPPGIYALERGQRDQQLRRLEELEQQLINRQSAI